MIRFELPYYNHTILNIVKSYCNYEILNYAQKTLQLQLVSFRSLLIWIDTIQIQ